jgi:fatty acid desaturase
MRPAVLAGVLSGIACGVVLGAMTGPFGVALGVGLGLVLGIIVGHVFEAEERRRDNRTRELDAIIGTTTGDMSAGPVSLASREAHQSRVELELWANEWLTPPPPPITY